MTLQLEWMVKKVIHDSNMIVIKWASEPKNSKLSLIWINASVLHFGQANQGWTFTINGRVLGSVLKWGPEGASTYFLESDDTVDGGEDDIWDSCLHWLGRRLQGLTVVLQLYKMLIRPHLQSFIQFGHFAAIRISLSWKRVQT